VGGIAGAILSIAGVIALLTPTESPSPRGKFESVTADPGQGLSEFKAHLQTASLERGGPGAGPAVYVRRVRVLRAAQLAQSPTDTAGLESTGTQTVPETTTPESTGTETTPTETTPREMTPTGPAPLQRPHIESSQLSDELRHRLPPNRLPRGWNYRTLNGRPGVEVPRKDCERILSSLGDAPPSAPGHCPQGEPSPASSTYAVVAATQLLRVFRATRTQPVAASGKTEPVGAAVNFNLTLDNLKGRTVIVRWSMYELGAGSPLPHDWLVNRRIYRERVDRSSQTVSRQFWVPLPRRKGPYFVRLTAWNGDNRLDYQDSKPPFR
jgi:hypothetical protein